MSYPARAEGLVNSTSSGIIRYLVAAAAFICFTFYTLPGTWVLNSFEELCIIHIYIWLNRTEGSRLPLPILSLMCSNFCMNHLIFGWNEFEKRPMFPMYFLLQLETSSGERLMKWQNNMYKINLIFILNDNIFLRDTNTSGTNIFVQLRHQRELLRPLKYKSIRNRYVLAT